MRNTPTQGEVNGPLIEAGEAFRRLTDPALVAPGPTQRERYDVVVIGGGQAGLSVGYHLAKRGLRFVILDAGERVGDSWRKRWDSLRLFSPASLDGLDGMPFPGPAHYFPTKDEMADYLEAYVERFRLPVRTGIRVENLTRRDGVYVIQTGGLEIEAAQVVVAMASYQRPRVPAFARELRPDIVQVHSKEYRNRDQLRPGGVLIVGAGNSGAEIAMDLAPRHRIWMSGRNVGEVPFRIAGLWARLFLAWFVMRVVFHRILTVRTPMGRKARPKMISQGGPLIRQKAADLAAARVERVSRIAGVRDGLPLLDDGRVLEVANVVWCTGFHPGFSWIDLPIFGADGEPAHRAGLVDSSPGLYFVGLHFLYSFSSSMIHGVGRDAARIAAAAAARYRDEGRQSAGEASISAAA